eukprot:12530736-Alexandrium_andersonii.AAC.1
MDHASLSVDHGLSHGRARWSMYEGECGTTVMETGTDKSPSLPCRPITGSQRTSMWVFQPREHST